MMYKEKKSFSWFSSKWSYGIICSVAIVVVISFFKELSRSHEINKEIANLQAQIVDIENENIETKDFVEYLKTNTYFEEQARRKLGLQEPGEKMLVINKDQLDENPYLNSETLVTNNNIQLQSNPEKWFKYFFQ